MAKTKEEETIQTTDKVEKTETRQKKSEKYTLLELVRQNKNQNDIYIKISEAGLHEQFLKELHDEREGLIIVPTITIPDFEKIIK